MTLNNVVDDDNEDDDDNNNNNTYIQLKTYRKYEVADCTFFRFYRLSMYIWLYSCLKL